MHTAAFTTLNTPRGFFTDLSRNPAAFALRFLRPSRKKHYIFFVTSVFEKFCMNIADSFGGGSDFNALTVAQLRVGSPP